MKCAYLGCSCEAPEIDPTCSEYCRAMNEKHGQNPEDAGGGEGDCRCGHDACVHPKEG